MPASLPWPGRPRPLGFAAAHTRSIRLIPNVVVLPYRNSFVVGKAGTTLDLLSDGRFTLAVGVGYLKREFTALGIDFNDRAVLVEEALQVIRAIWTSDDVSFEGKNFTTSVITAHPRPASPAPIWTGGNTGAARRRVAAYGDGEELAALGVTWGQVQVPGDSLAHTKEAIAQFGEQVIAKL